MKRWKSVALVGLFAVLVGCSQAAPPATPAPSQPAVPAPVATPAPAPKTPDPKQFILLGGVGQASISDLMSLTLETGLKLEFPNALVRRTPGGINETAPALKNKTIDAGVMNSNSAYLAYKGMPPFKEPHPDMRYLYSLGDAGTVDIVVPANSPINSIEDLKNKRIGVGSQTSATHIWFSQGLAGVNLSFDIIKANGGAVNYGNFNDQFDQMADGQLDAVILGTNHPSQLVLQLAASKGVKILSLGQKAIDAIIAANPGSLKVTFRKETYDFMKENITSFAFVVGIYVDKSMPEDVAYRMVKTMFDEGNLEKVWYSAKESWRKVELRKLASVGSSIPVHPGALRYFKENNIEVANFGLPQ